METVSETEVQELQREINRLQKEISDLKKIHSEKSYMNLHGNRNCAVEDRYIPNVLSNKELPLTSTVLKQMLALNDDLNGITFSAVQKTKIASGIYKLDAECKAYHLLFHLTCDLLTEPDESITVMTLKVTFQDASRVDEIMHFINSCHREKNLQELLSGLGRYAELSDVRETVVSWMCSEFHSAVRVKYSVDDDGTYAIGIYGNVNRELYLTCNWGIRWQKKTRTLNPFLDIFIHNDGFPPERRGFVQRMCEKPPCDKEGTKEAWKEIIDCIANMD